MACIERNPNCGIGGAGESVPEPLPQIGSALGVIGAIIGAVIGIAGALDKIPAVVAALGGAVGASAISAALAVVAVIIIIGVFGLNRCQQGEGLRTCIAGVVSYIEESFSDAGQEIFPFTSQHTSDSGAAIAVGDLLTVNGNMAQRDYDNKANVLWWVSSTAFHGRVRDGTPHAHLILTAF